MKKFVLFNSLLAIATSISFSHSILAFETSGIRRLSSLVIGRKSSCEYFPKKDITKVTITDTSERAEIKLFYGQRNFSKNDLLYPTLLPNEAGRLVSSSGRAYLDGYSRIYPDGYIDTVSVHPEHRAKGLARILLTEAAHHWHAQGAEFLRWEARSFRSYHSAEKILTTQQLVEFYKRYGAHTSNNRDFVLPLPTNHGPLR